MHRSFAPVIVIAILFFTSCDNRRIYEGTRDFPKRQWVMNETAEFEFVLPGPDQRCNLYYSIRHSNEYPFQNLYLQYYLEDSTGNLLSKNLDNIQLFEPVTGIPIGDGLGDIFVLKKVFLENYAFKNPGLYRLRVDHFMRMDTLPEILSIGIRVESSEAPKSAD